MRAAAAMLAALALAGCGEAESNRAEEANVMWPAADGGPHDNVAAMAEKEAPPILDTAWTGRFAASAALCASEPWDVGAERVLTAGGSDCAVRRVGRAPAQVTVELACTGEGDESWTVTPRQDGGIAVARSPAGRETVQLDLVRCR